ncbi:MAG: prenyltransferase/squalene oxidase repeat-containing protein [Verrucomicrobiota bacterium]
MLHVQLSPEALENLRRQKRNSTVSSILVSVLVVAVIFLVMGIFMLDLAIKETPTIVTYESSTEVEDTMETKKVSTQVSKKPSAPSSSMTKVIAASSSNSAVSIPVPDVVVTTPSMDFGDGADFGGGWGSAGDFGDGGGFSKIPSTMRQRCSAQDRMDRLKQSGGSVKGETAVVNALDFLQKTQNADGSWDTTHPVAMTGFALLAYLGHCETPQSKKYGDTVLKAITYLVNVGLKNNNKLTNKPDNSIQWVYDHGIATYALAEAYTFCSKLNYKVPDLDKVTKEAGEIVINGQAPSGGWNYVYGKGNTGDNSVGYWQIQAMKACKHTGLWKDSEFKKPSRLALDWLEKVQGPDGAIGYRESSTRSPGLTGGGVLAFQMWGEGDHKAVKKGIEWIDKNAKFNWKDGKYDHDTNLYYHYYHIQAMLNHGGKEWDKYNEMVRDPLINAQAKDGSWTQKVGNHGPVNTHMATCMATLSLEVYYRFLPSSEK